MSCLRQGHALDTPPCSWCWQCSAWWPCPWLWDQKWSFWWSGHASSSQDMPGEESWLCCTGFPPSPCPLTLLWFLWSVPPALGRGSATIRSLIEGCRSSWEGGNHDDNHRQRPGIVAAVALHRLSPRGHRPQQSPASAVKSSHSPKAQETLKGKTFQLWPCFFSPPSSSHSLPEFPHTHTHWYIHIYVYIYIWWSLCVYENRIYTHQLESYYWLSQTSLLISKFLMQSQWIRDWSFLKCLNVFKFRIFIDLKSYKLNFFNLKFLFKYLKE